MSAPDTLDNPLFARIWTFMSSRETDWLRDRRRENLEGLSGRVLEIGAGTGSNFGFYPDTVTEVVAAEPESRLRDAAVSAAAAASVPITVVASTVEALDSGSPSTRSCARWSCVRSIVPRTCCASCSPC